MINTGDLRRGTIFQLDEAPCLVLDVSFQSPTARGGNTLVKTKYRNLLTNQVLNKSFKSGDRLDEADFARRKGQFLYADGDQYHFMNTTNYDQITIPKDNLGDAALYLLEQMEVAVLFHNGQALSIEVPNFVVLEITHADPGVKGNTAAGATKPATLETGAVVNVPLFVEQGERVKVDTRTGEYVERAK